MIIYTNYVVMQYNYSTNQDKNVVRRHNFIQEVAYPVLIGTIITGNIVYIFKKYNQYGNNFNLLTYYLGTPKCLKMKNI